MSATIYGNVMYIDLSGSEIIENNRTIFSERARDQCNYVINENNMSFFGGYENLKNFTCEMDKEALLLYKDTLMKLPNQIKAFYVNGMSNIGQACDNLLGREMKKLICPDSTHRAIIFNKELNSDGTTDYEIYRKIFYEGLSALEIEKDDNAKKLTLKPKFKPNSPYLAKYNKIINAGSGNTGNIVMDDEEYNKIIYGVPGVGKSFEISNVKNKFKEQERTVFHPEYTNADFVGQLLPKYNASADRIEYKYEAGPFTRILSKALLDDDPNNKYMLIIEEINRGNAAAIFGEIFQLLDRENGDSKYYIDNQDISQYIKNKFKESGKDFNDIYKDKLIKYKPNYDDKNDNIVFIPKNLYIWATMNTSDQNVFVLDTAFQRRWVMDMVTINFDLDLETTNHGETVIGGSHNLTWRKFVEKINLEIINNKSNIVSTEDKRLGTFFASKQEIENKKKFVQKVIKYLWDDAFKLEKFEGKIFDLKNYPTLESMVNACENNNVFIEDFFVSSFFINNTDNSSDSNTDSQFEDEVDDQDES